MNSRISLVLKAKNISPAQLADDIGVQRSGISHILNGRNKPSLDFIQKLLKRYPDISMSWLMFGDGPMMNPYPSSETNKKEQPNFSEIKPSLIDLFSTTDEGMTENDAPEPVKTEQNGSNKSENEMITSLLQEEAKSIQKNSDQLESLSGVGSANAAVGSANAAVISANAAVGSANAVVGSANVPVGSANEKYNPEHGKITNEGKTPRITKIVIFYDNRTFVEYSPGNE